MKIQIAGPGCPRCEVTERNVFNACAELNLAAHISHVRDVKQFAALGVVLTPAVLAARSSSLARCPPWPSWSRSSPRSASAEPPGHRVGCVAPTLAHGPLTP